MSAQGSLRCEWENCPALSTHTVVIRFPDIEPETWRVCRAHDRLLKLQAVRSRPRTTPEPDAPPVATPQCGQCRRVLVEPTDLADEDCPPCPDCGSSSRHLHLAISERATVHEVVRVRRKALGWGGWRVDVRTGDDYTRDLAAWGKLERTKDRDGNLYREVIDLYDGTCITSTGRLSDHHD